MDDGRDPYGTPRARSGRLAREKPYTLETEAPTRPARSSKRAWFIVRLTALLAVLGSVLLYAFRDVSRRGERNEWTRTLDVALVVVRDGSVSDAAVLGLRERTRALEARLGEELRRYRGAPAKPFSFVWYGPTALGEPLPSSHGDGLVDLARTAWELRRFTSDVDARAGVPSRGFDARVYLVVRPPSARGFVEGMSEHGGWVGVALADLDESTVDLALFVAAHELFHTLGATDRYGPDGSTLIPDGLAEPDRSPPFPQEFAEVMARNRPIDEHEEVPPASLDELRVGPRTAAEIGWTAPGDR